MRIADVFSRIAGSEFPVEVRAYDGSSTGDRNAPVRLEINSPLALSYFASAPGQLGVARAYVAGTIDVVGDMHTGLSLMPKLSMADIPRDLRLKVFAKLAAARFWWPVQPPPQESNVRGRRHSKNRDANAIHHHYDVSNTFYRYVLGPSMAYTCAVYGAEKDSLEQAQFNKHDLIAKKIGLREGMRLLDVGCGWGGMVLHAAREYGVRAIGVTLSKQQAEWGQRAIKEAGLDHLAEIRHSDYRDIPETEFDAISSIGLTEHIGMAEIPGYFRSLYAKLVPGGRMLNHCITRPDDSMAAETGPFINGYVFPDGELEGPGWLASTMNAAGFEIRHSENLREHYALTLRDWCANLEENWQAAVAEVGIATARVWRLYMAASRMGFDRNMIQLHQILGVKLDGENSHMPLRPSFT
ncbi:SAM-dependent methyltransferase [Sciscionella sediminilitoris]|uniref:SAM-dependent methyltransferase n=1 Tax=Sciscionella sediminilitoris TaxID=1445613 RepID=UPI0004DFCA24|nr:cyclopropane-fatty-acyl-phospholipid synthase family protein [Sciscionella sp. SE31]